MSEIPLCQSKIDYDMIPNHSRSISKNDVEKLNLERITIIPTNENSYTSLNGDFFLDDS